MTKLPHGTRLVLRKAAQIMHWQPSSHLQTWCIAGVVWVVGTLALVTAGDTNVVTFAPLTGAMIACGTGQSSRLASRRRDAAKAAMWLAKHPASRLSGEPTSPER
jgi:hypothetical protein